MATIFKSRIWLPLLSVALIVSAGLFWLTSNTHAATDEQIWHILTRVSYGVIPGELVRLQKTGISAYLQAQLDPESISEPPQLVQQLARLKTLQLTSVEISRQYSRGKKAPSPVKQPARMPLEEAIQAKLLRAIASNRQLQEVMVDFWFNHFNVYAGRSSPILYWAGNYEERAIRPHVLGHFRDLLGTTARHPAMLHYLNNWRNTAPNSPGATKKLKGLNENYARELMELHSLGVDGGYTQADIMTLARIFTGWTYDLTGLQGDENGFYFNAERHDRTDKVFLGMPIPGGGIEEGDRALDILARHPSTAHHISYKLAQYFVADTPPEQLVKRLAEKFLATEGDIRAVLATLFNSPEFNEAKYYGSKFKTPYQYIVSAVRAAGLQNPDLKAIARSLQLLEMPLYQYPMPNGYANTQDIWLNPDALLRRLNWATSLTQGHMQEKLGKQKLTSVDASQLRQTFGSTLSDSTQTAINNSLPELQAALLLGSPEMMHR